MKEEQIGQAEYNEPLKDVPSQSPELVDGTVPSKGALIKHN